MTSAHLIDATTMMLRELNSKIDHLKHGNNGVLSPEGVIQIQKMMEEQTKQLKAIAEQSKNEGVSEEKMRVLLERQMDRWKADQNVFLTDSLKSMSEEIRKTIRERPPSPETINPHRHFIKEVGVVEDMSSDVHLFFPLDNTVKQPPKTFVIREITTMNPMLLHPVLKELLNLPKNDPTRSLMSNGLIPAGNLGNLSMETIRSMILLEDEFWIRACLSLIETKGISSFSISVPLAIWIGQYRTEEQSQAEMEAWLSAILKRDENERIQEWNAKPDLQRLQEYLNLFPKEQWVTKQQQWALLAEEPRKELWLSTFREGNETFWKHQWMNSIPNQEATRLRKAWKEQGDRLRQFIVPKTGKGTFNATLLLLFGYKMWPASGEIHPAYQALQSFFSTHMAGRFIDTFPEPLDTRIPREVFFLWTAVLKWNTTMS